MADDDVAVFDRETGERTGTLPIGVAAKRCAQVTGRDWVDIANQLREGMSFSTAKVTYKRISEATV